MHSHPLDHASSHTHCFGGYFAQALGKICHLGVEVITGRDHRRSGTGGGLACQLQHRFQFSHPGAQGVVIGFQFYARGVTPSLPSQLFVVGL